MRRIGVLVNPIAGMGGRVGLKGTDGKFEAARERGAEPRAGDRARTALRALADADPTVEVLVAGGSMGADAARDAGFEPVVVTDPPTELGATAATDTRDAVRAFCEAGVDLVLFVGGDGTAVDVAKSVNDETPILGVPAGVKVFSAVFAVTPAAAGHIAATFDETERAEVNDVDEAAYQAGEVITTLRELAQVPVAAERQASKQLAGGTVAGLAAGVAADVDPAITYVFGPGSTVGAIADRLDFEATPLGVDVWRDGEVAVRDAGESAILDALGDHNEIIVSPIGGQGFVFGRGNQQLSPAVIRQCDVTIVAARRKLADIGVLRVDTGDPDLDAELRGWWRVRVGRVEQRLIEVV